MVTKRRRRRSGARTHNVHDQYFRRTFQHAEMVDAVLRTHLDPGIVALLASGLPERLDPAFIRTGSRMERADLVFRYRRRGGRGRWIFCVLEHKGRIDRKTGIQQLGYIDAIWDQHDKESRRSKLPPVVALVVYSGARAWGDSGLLTDAVDAPDPVRPFVPEFGYGIVDAGHRVTGGLGPRGVLGVMALSMGRATRGSNAPRRP